MNEVNEKGQQVIFRKKFLLPFGKQFLVPWLPITLICGPFCFPQKNLRLFLLSSWTLIRASGLVILTHVSPLKAILPGLNKSIWNLLDRTFFAHFKTWVTNTACFTGAFRDISIIIVFIKTDE